MSDYISKQALIDWLQAQDQVIPYSNLRRIIAAGKFDTSDQGGAASQYAREVLYEVRQHLNECEEARYIVDQAISVLSGDTEPVGAQLPQVVTDCIRKCRMNYSDRDVMEIAIADYNSKTFQIMQDYARSEFERFLMYMAATCDMGINTGEGKENGKTEH